jgi:hypothetical protein
MNLLTIEEKKTPDKRNANCLYCSSSSIERIPRGRIIKTVFYWLPLKHYMCYACLKKHYRY